ncbi:MAG TPA: hypothetical protein VKQ52_19795, partial [Puia sp.]|nr:hypothetical protein [Puia sp.]
MNTAVSREPFPASRKIYVPGKAHALQVAMREIQTGDGPVTVYDTSGPYTDPAVGIDLERGLPRVREAWVKERRGGGNVTQMHYARKGIITPEMEYIAIRENQR